MSRHEQGQLDSLLAIAEERDSPLSDWEKEFVTSLDDRRDRDMSPKQAEVFDRLVEKHLR
jgi:hypothetical protein